MKKIYITLFSCLSFLGYSQGENDHWYFGFKAAVNFSYVGNPTPLVNSEMLTYLEPVGSISDSDGNLLFYSDGKNIWNREHQIMSNGTINTNNSVSWRYGNQLAILKHPGNPNLYYIFTPIPNYYNNLTVSNGISSYTVVDMSLGNTGSNNLPLGDVLPNNNSLPFSGANELPFAANNVNIVKHSDNKSFWVVIPNKTKLYSYLVNSQGLINSPVVSDVPANIPNFSPVAHPSYLKISPKVNVSNNFSNYLYIVYWGGVNANDWASSKVLSFNNTTGKITTDFVLDITTNPGSGSSGEFTNNGSIFYLGSNGSSKVYGIDMVNISPTSVNYYTVPINYSSSSDGPLDIQRNKYGHIYMSFDYSNSYLAKIINQNVFNGANIDIHDLYLDGKAAGRNLPQLVQYNNNIGECVQDIPLTSSEPNNAFVYRAANSIITTNYSIASNQNIEMKAGSYILLKPNTDIKGKFSAKIEGCRIGTLEKFSGNSKFDKPIRLSLDLRTPVITENKILISPNPTSDILNIKSDSKINNVSVVDMIGRNINVRLDGEKVDVKNLPSGTYIINIETKEGVSTQKFIKK
ncbi:T9SS type A sorting domain-containing protein [Chryseobacterium schmidteae]|uniref:T9SS type A sorting domain-containing protein n=1 Tax=Chryseobacterium schmidteae TaxID=2730404 RepID=UPI00158D6ED5|nr:T9SS type A sorting domain-containing protein [Chryseobacterium schmidteae]